MAATPRDDVLTVRRPRRGKERVIAAFRQRYVVRAVNIACPDVFSTAAVAKESDLLAVGRKLWLALEWNAADDSFSFAAAREQRVDVAEQVEDYRLPVG